jgi:hypothetical protein
MQLNIKVGRGQIQILTNLVYGKFQPFAHEEKSTLHRRQFVDTGVQDLHKLATTQIPFWIAPVGRSLVEVPVGTKANRVKLVKIIVFARQAADADFAAVLAQQINDFVFEYSNQPGSNACGLRNAASTVSETASSAHA